MWGEQTTLVGPRRQPLGNNPIHSNPSHPIPNPTRLHGSCDLSLQADESEKAKSLRRNCVLFTFYVDLFLPCNLNAQTFKFSRGDHLMASSVHKSCPSRSHLRPAVPVTAIWCWCCFAVARRGVDGLVSDRLPCTFYTRKILVLIAVKLLSSPNSEFFFSF